jgi:hypothetical protein
MCIACLITYQTCGHSLQKVYTLEPCQYQDKADRLVSCGVQHKDPRLKIYESSCALEMEIKTKIINSLCWPCRRAQMEEEIRWEAEKWRDDIQARVQSAKEKLVWQMKEMDGQEEPTFNSSRDRYEAFYRPR